MSDAKFQALSNVAPVSRETFDRLIRFEQRFRKWAAAINLASTTTLDELWLRHVIDSAQVLPLAPDAARWTDIGSGGGFPGAVVAIMIGERADARVELVESNRKKAAFLRASLHDLAPHARVHAVRVEDYLRSADTPQIVTARALAPLTDLLEITEPWLSRGARALFHKGRDYRSEIEVAHDRWNLDLVRHPSVVGEGGVVLEVLSARRR